MPPDCDAAKAESLMTRTPKTPRADRQNQTNLGTAAPLYQAGWPLIRRLEHTKMMPLLQRGRKH